MADHAPTIAAGLSAAAKAIDSGAAKAALDKLIRVSNAELSEPVGEAVP